MKTMITSFSTRRAKRQRRQNRHALSRLTTALSIVAIAYAWRWLRLREVTIVVEILWFDMWRGTYLRPRKPDDTMHHLYYCPVECLVFHLQCPIRETLFTTTRELLQDGISHY